MKLPFSFPTSSTPAAPGQKQIRYGGFHARMCASIIDMFLSAVLLLPLLKLISPLIYGNTTPQEVMRLVAADVAHQMADSQKPSIVRFFTAILHDERTYHYFMVDGGLWRTGLEQSLQIAVTTAIYLYCWIRISATPGKVAMALKIVDADTFGSPTRKQFYLRFLGYLVSTLPLGLGFLWIAFDKKKQGWHDKIAHTVVIKR